MFCAAIPATMALGMSAQANQNRKRKEAKTKGEQEPKPVIPAGPATVAVVLLLVTGSIVVHTHSSWIIQ
jgi:hypothetical protein